MMLPACIVLAAVPGSRIRRCSPKTTHASTGQVATSAAAAYSPVAPAEQQLPAPLQMPPRPNRLSAFVAGISATDSIVSLLNNLPDLANHLPDLADFLSS